MKDRKVIVAGSGVGFGTQIAKSHIVSPERGVVIIQENPSKETQTRPLSSKIGSPFFNENRRTRRMRERRNKKRK